VTVGCSHDTASFAVEGIRRFYPTKVKVTDKQLATVDLHPHRFHGEWNYTIKHQVISV
jgi:hypothetical protein